MRNLLILTDIKLNNINLIKDNDEIIYTVRSVSEEELKRMIVNNTCRSFVGKKEIVNLFKINQKVQIVKASSIDIKIYDKILIYGDKGEYIILEPVKLDVYYKLIKVAYGNKSKKGSSNP